MEKIYTIAYSMKKLRNKSGKNFKPENSDDAFHSGGPVPDLNKLHAYKKIKLELASLLHIVRETFHALGREIPENQCEELIVKLAEDRFVLAVLGQFQTR